MLFYPISFQYFELSILYMQSCPESGSMSLLLLFSVRLPSFLLEYVIQKYVKSPKLWNGHKFHFRMYALLTGCMSTFIYEKAFILTAGIKYDCDDDDVHKHITNLSVNKKLHGHPGQIPVNMKESYPEVNILLSSLTINRVLQSNIMLPANNLFN